MQSKPRHHQEGTEDQHGFYRKNNGKLCHKRSEMHTSANISKHKKTNRKVNLTKTEPQNTSADSVTPTPPVSDTKPIATGNAVETFMSAQSAKPATDVDVKGVRFKLSATKMSYRTNAASVARSCGSLIDGGANGGLAGADVRLISSGNAKADVTGINDTVIADVPIGTVAGLIQTNEGPAIAVMHQYAYVGTGDTIHSVNQLECFGLNVDDKPKCNNGK